MSVLSAKETNYLQICRISLSNVLHISPNCKISCQRDLVLQDFFPNYVFSGTKLASVNIRRNSEVLLNPIPVYLKKDEGDMEKQEDY